MKIGCCIDMEYYTLAAEAGYDFINLPGKAVYAMTDNDFQKVKSTILKGNLPCPGVNSYCPAEIILAGPNYSAKKIQEYGEFTINRLAQLGVKQLGIGCPNSRKLPPNFDIELAKDQMCHTLEITTQIANKYGMEVLLESLCTLETNFLNTTKECVEVLERLNIPNLKMVYDVYHVAMMKEDPEDFKMASKYITFAHISDGDNGRRIYMSPDNLSPYRPYINNLISPEYKGDIAIEVLTDDHQTGLVNTYKILENLFK